MKSIHVVIVGLVLMGGGYYFYSSRTQTPSEQVKESAEEKKFIMEEATTEATLSAETKKALLNGQSLEEHKMAMDDGSTIMMMGGVYSPTTLYVSPGQLVTVANHEAKPLSLMSDDHKAFSTLMIKSGEEGAFQAPTKPGTYTFHNSAHLNVKGTLVVEE